MTNTPDDWKLSAHWPQGTMVCNSAHNGVLCTRPRGHSGDHVAGSWETLVAQWEQS